MHPTQIQAANHRLRLGLRIQSARKTAELSQQELAAQCGLTAQRVALIERGVAVIRAAERFAIERALPAVAEKPAPVRRITRLQDLPDLCKVAVAADYLDVTSATVWRMLRRGALERVKVGSRTRIPRSSLAQYAGQTSAVAS